MYMWASMQKPGFVYFFCKIEILWPVHDIRGIHLLLQYDTQFPFPVRDFALRMWLMNINKLNYNILNRYNDIHEPINEIHILIMYYSLSCKIVAEVPLRFIFTLQYCYLIVFVSSFSMSLLFTYRT